VLSLRSPVFRAMFYGPLAETTSVISVPDVTPTAFKAMLTYIYRDTVRLQTLQGAWQLWYAARKYMIDSLEENCRKVRREIEQFVKENNAKILNCQNCKLVVLQAKN
jgi:hypothetical protein